MSMLSFACDQDQNTAYFPRTEINPLAPNPDTAKLINFSFVETEADKILNIPCVDRPMRHDLQNRLMPLGLVYKITGETKYAERAWQELDTYTKFNHWNPTTQFLDIAYISEIEI